MDILVVIRTSDELKTTTGQLFLQKNQEYQIEAVKGLAKSNKHAKI